MRAVATVETSRPERYAKQLASHLGRKCEIREEDDGAVVILGGGECLLFCGDGSLELRATAPEQESLDRVKQVVGSHLERFGVSDELVVTWQVVAD